MEDLLVDKEHRAAMDPSTKRTAMSSEDWDKLDIKVRSIILLCLSYSILMNVSREDSAKKLCETLGNLY